MVNLQWDMPNIEPRAISNLVNYMKKNQCDIATLASLLHPDHVYDPNVVKVFTRHIPQNKIKEAIKESAFFPVSDFDRNITNLIAKAFNIKLKGVSEKYSYLHVKIQKLFECRH